MTKATYIKKSTLDFPCLWNHFGMSKDSGGRWFTGDDTQSYVNEYLVNYRTPSRAYPNSYAVALLSQKFAKLVVEKEPGLAVKLKIAV